MIKRLLPIVAVVLLTNGLALFLAARNARGPADAVVTVTEREMRVTNMGSDTTGMTLTIQWDRRAPLRWFDRAKLTSIGFDCSTAPDAAGAEAYYGGPALLPRQAYVVFEYDPSRIAGDVAADDVQSEGSPLAGRVKVVPEYVSRLRPVDVGSDPGALRSRYADRARYLITAGTVRASLVRATEKGPRRLQGQVLWIDPIQVYVPQELQKTIVETLGKDGNREGASATLTHAPRYEVTLEYGASHLPRIAGVK